MNQLIREHMLNIHHHATNLANFGNYSNGGNQNANNGIVVNNFDQSPMANSNLNNMHSNQDGIDLKLMNDKDQAKKMANQ